MHGTAVDGTALFLLREYDSDYINNFSKWDFPIDMDILGIDSHTVDQLLLKEFVLYLIACLHDVALR